MGTRIATGCSECNGDIAYAEILMAAAPGYCSWEMYQRIPLPKPRVLFDGEDMTGKEVVCISTSLGLMTRNHLIRLPSGEWSSHLCGCESGYVAVELWEGAVVLEARDLYAELAKVAVRRFPRWTSRRSS